MNRRAWLVFALLLGGCVFNVTETHFFHPGPAKPGSKATGEARTVVAADGVKLGGVYYSHPGAKADLLYFGGDSFQVDNFGDELASYLTALGVNVYMFDHRGYGRSAGTPTLEAVQNDALAVYDYVRAQSDGRPLVVHGFSLGSFLAAHIAVNRPISGLILESTAPDVRSWASASVPAYARAGVRLKIAPKLEQESNLERLKTFKGPLLLITGADDAITPPRFAQQLHAASATPPDQKRVVIVEDARHGNTILREPMRTAYGEFLAAIQKM